MRFLGGEGVLQKKRNYPLGPNLLRERLGVREEEELHLSLKLCPRLLPFVHRDGAVGRRGKQPVESSTAE